MNQKSSFSDDTVQAIADYLSCYKHKLEALMQGSFTNLEFELGTKKLGCFITEVQEKELNALDPLNRQLALRKVVGELLRDHGNSQNFINLACWVIETWGGISSGNNQDFAKALITKFDFSEFNCLPFERIASSSKVASFINPQKYVVYDSRVAHAINWILLSTSRSKRYFPVPEGRNSKLVAFDINVLIRIANSEMYKADSTDELGKMFVSIRDKSLYIEKNDAYRELNNLLVRVSDKLWPEEEFRLLKTEILLFCIAAEEVFFDISRRVHLTIDEGDIG